MNPWCRCRLDSPEAKLWRGTDTIIRFPSSEIDPVKSREWIFKIRDLETFLLKFNNHSPLVILENHCFDLKYVSSHLPDNFFSKNQRGWEYFGTYKKISETKLIKKNCYISFLTEIWRKKLIRNYELFWIEQCSLAHLPTNFFLIKNSMVDRMSLGQKPSTKSPRTKATRTKAPRH